MQDAMQGGARIRYHVANLGRARELADQVRGRCQFFQFSDPQIVSARHLFLQSKSNLYKRKNRHHWRFFQKSV
jgi:hypothetical protein